MKSILKYAAVAAIVLTTFALTACGNQLDFDVQLSNGNDVVIELDGFSMTNQDLLNLLMSGNIDGQNPGVSVILDWVDLMILPDLVEIDESLIDNQRESLEELDADNLEVALITNGFADIDDLLVSTRLQMMRTQAVRDSVVYTEEELYEVFNELFAPSEDDDEVQTFEEVRDNLENFLVTERISAPGYTEAVLARLREEAGMVIYSEYFAIKYSNFLNADFTDELDITTSTSDTTIVSVNTANAVESLTLEDFFATVINRFAFRENSRLFDHLDLHVLDEIYNVNRRTINDDITQAKTNLLDWFYPQMEFMGLYSEEEIFDWFWLNHLQNLAFDDHITLSDDRVEYLHANYTVARETSHILVGDYDLALELITRLQAVSADELNALFAELAIEYSTCGSAPNGGTLGRLSIPSGMVQEFENATFELAEGSFSTTPVESQHGYHIILVDYFDQLPSLATIRTQEMNRLRESPEYLAGVMFTLRAEHNIVFHNELLQSRYNVLLETNRRNTTN